MPTRLLCYSLKSKGIAKDIFGTDKNYCLPVSNLDSVDDMVEGFKWLNKNKNEVLEKLEKEMPKYIQKAELAGELIKNV